MWALDIIGKYTNTRTVQKEELFLVICPVEPTIKHTKVMNTTPGNTVEDTAAVTYQKDHQRSCIKPCIHPLCKAFSDRVCVTSISI